MTRTSAAITSIAVPPTGKKQRLVKRLTELGYVVEISRSPPRAVSVALSAREFVARSVLLFPPRRPASALWMTNSRIVREVKVASGTGGVVGVLEEPRLSTSSELDWSWAAVAMAYSALAEAGFAGDLCRDAAYAGGAEGPDQTRPTANDARGIAQMMRVGL